MTLAFSVFIRHIVRPAVVMRGRDNGGVMPMIGGEAAESAALARRHVDFDAPDDLRDPYELGWVMDWLYGDAVLPPMPLPPEPEPVPFPRRRHVAPMLQDAPLVPEPHGHRGRRRTRQLALL
ncbi:MAG TPA: hypothetical protein VF006_27955 [Longimicrobium sp.]